MGKETGGRTHSKQADVYDWPRCLPCSGSIPATWEGLGRLEFLWIYSNRLTGSVPAALGCRDCFPRLTSLRLANNRLSGSLPLGCGTMRGSRCAAPLGPSPLHTL